MRYPLSLMALLLAGTTPVFAQNAGVFDLDEIVFSPNLVPVELSSVGSSVSVITSGQLQKAGDLQLSTFLSRLPGVSVTQSGPIGGSANIRIRGADARYIAVYIDGILVTDPTELQVRYDFGALSVADIERVEILRGSQSALYGGSAVGGVINITSKRPDQDGVAQRLDLKAGSYGTLGANYTLTQKTSALETSISLSRLESDGFSAVEESPKNPNPKPDGFESVSLSASIKYQISENASLGATFLSQDDKSGFDGFNLTDAENIRQREQIGGSVFTEFSTGSVVNKIQISGYRIERELKNVGFSDNLYDGSRATLSYRGYIETDPSTTLVWGAETTKENYETDFSEGSGRSNSIYGQILWSPVDKLNLDSTFRFDNSSGFGTFTTGRLAAAYQLNDVITLRGAAGTGFRAPSLEERFAEYDFRDPDPIFPSTYYFQGNPNVEPETSKSFELGLEAEMKNGMIFSGTLFRLKTDNMIRGCGEFEAVECDRVLPQNVTASYENRKGISSNSGIELAANIPINASLLLDANYTYIDAKNPQRIRLGRTPRHEFGMSVSAALTDRLSGVLSIQHVADRLDRDGEQPLKDYTVTNLNLSYTLTDKASLTFLVENLFDEQYQQVAGYGTSDRAFYVGLSSRF